MSAGLRFLGAGLIALLAIWAGARMYSRSARHRTVAVSAGVASAPDPKDLGPDGILPRPVVPAQLPAFSLSDTAGKPVSILSFSGKSLVINFWATWCAPCQREIPLLKTLAAEWAGRDFNVVGIAVDYPDKVLEFAHRFDIDYPLLVGEQDALDVAAKFGMASPAFPFTVFTDRRGEVVTLFVGELHRRQADFILSVVQHLNENSVLLPAAQRAIAQGLGDMPKETSG